MIDANDVQRMNETLCVLAHEKFSVRADTLDKAMRKIGRRVPRRVHRQAQVLSEAARFAGHPKLRMAVDAAEVRKAYAAVESHLRSIDPRDRRTGAILGVLGSIAFSLIIVFALVVAVLVWRGFL